VARVVLVDAPDVIAIPPHLLGKRLLITFRPMDGEGETDLSAVSSISVTESKESPA
jgi:hypothetical protein